MHADKAVAEWMKLWERVQDLPPTEARADIHAFDPATGRPLSVLSLLESLPPPATWPALRAAMLAKANANPDGDDALGLALLSAALSADKTFILAQLKQAESRLAGRSPEEREAYLPTLSRIKVMTYRLYGTSQEIANSFSESVDVAAAQDYSNMLEVPDLVGLVGAEKAEALLRAALKRSVELKVPEGEQTLQLARKLVLQDLASIRKPQWSLVNSLGTMELYEAMQRRFDPAANLATPAEEEGKSERWNFERSSADVYYFLDLVVAGKHAQADRVLERMPAHHRTTLPRQAMQSLVKAGKNEAVYAFLAGMLEKRPQAPAWDLFLEQAGYLGKGEEAIAILEKMLARNDLPGYLRELLGARLVQALLAADKIDPAVASMRKVLATAPSKDDRSLAERAEIAQKMSSLGRLLKRSDLSEEGFAFLAKAVPLLMNVQHGVLSELLAQHLAELRRQGKQAEAQALALEVLAFNMNATGARATLMAFEPGLNARTLVELAGIYHAAGKPGDVLRLMNEAALWGARDLLQLVDMRDSIGVPMGFIAAKALQVQGQPKQAIQVLDALLDKLPGYDPAYELLIGLKGPQASADLDQRYLRDQFEERPLIWKAVVQFRAGKAADAEVSIKRAISIDPSDGEQGKNDRMRAYAVLADILQARGDAAGAKLYRGAVSAIRLSEQADELHALGLYQRAFAAYRAALGEFSDAYCIQSRLAVQLSKQGRMNEALQHYRKAYELMPDSFGRVESHCFGCESVFADVNAQSVAEQIFTDMVKRPQAKPQAFYMLGYLRKEQGRYAEALINFRQAIALDGQYLNAWKNLHEIAGKTYVDSGERDIARLKLLELDPAQRHVKYQLTQVADVAGLWKALKAKEKVLARVPAVALYPLKRSTKEQDDQLAGMPPEMKSQLEGYLTAQRSMAAAGFRQHQFSGQALIALSATFAGGTSAYSEFD